MATIKSLMDEVIFEAVINAETTIEDFFDSDVIYYYGELRIGFVQYFRDVIERVAEQGTKKNALTLCLTTPGGQAEAVEKMVEIIRHHYDKFYALVPSTAMSAGTIMCMAADKIYMDYSSALGPIDPQIPDKEGKRLLPALGYLDKYNELVNKSASGQITPGEFVILQNQDLAMLNFCEQAKELSVTLLKNWLVEYKFKDWVIHSTTNPGSEVTHEEKEARAEEIAKLLSDNKTWHSHGRMIGMKTLKSVLKLIIEDFGVDANKRNAIRRYSDTLNEYLERQGVSFHIFNRHVI